MSSCRYFYGHICERMHRCDGCELQSEWNQIEKKDFDAFRVNRLVYKDGERFIIGCYYCGSTLTPLSADYEKWLCPQCGYRTTAEMLIKLYKTTHHIKEVKE